MIPPFYVYALWTTLDEARPIILGPVPTTLIVASSFEQALVAAQAHATHRGGENVRQLSLLGAAIAHDDFVQGIVNEVKAK